MARRLQLPALTKHLQWAERSVQPWRQWLGAPTPIHEERYYMWLHTKMSSNDVPTLYLSMSILWLAISPLHAKGASRSAFMARIFAMTQVALSATILRTAHFAHQRPKWLRAIWQLLPAAHQDGIACSSFSWFISLLPWMKAQPGRSAVYIAFTHPGVYIGKANLHRAGKKASVPERLLEHMVGLTLTKSRRISGRSVLWLLPSTPSSTSTLPLVQQFQNTRMHAAPCSGTLS